MNLQQPLNSRRPSSWVLVHRDLAHSSVDSLSRPMQTAETCKKLRHTFSISLIQDECAFSKSANNSLADWYRMRKHFSTICAKWGCKISERASNSIVSWRSALAHSSSKSGLK